MKRLKYLLLASLVAFAACDEETAGPDTQTGSVRVTVTAGGSPLQGITVSLGAAGTQPVVTGTDGIANFATVPVGTYTVTVTGLTADVVCSSTTQPVTVAAGQTTAVTFACNIVQTSSISGTVAFSNGDPRPNASVTITRTAPAGGTAVTLTTNANGQYSLTGLRSGTYTVSLPVTEGCTTAANTQTVQLAAGEARVVNFTCTSTPPPEQEATIAIESITMTSAQGTQVPVQPNALRGQVTFHLGIDEGDEEVTRVLVRLGDDVICEQQFTSAAPQDMQLAVFDVDCTENLAEFDLETGAPNFLNADYNLIAQIFTVQGGATAPADAATLSVRTVNVDATYAVVTASRQIGLSTSTSAFGTGLAWRSGDLTVRALPVMYSGLGVQQVTVSVFGFVPEDDTDLVEYMDGDGDFFTVSRMLTGSAPYTTTLSADNAINEEDDPFDDENGIGDVEDPVLDISVSVLRADGQPGPFLDDIDEICSDGLLPSTNFPPTGCRDGQEAQALRWDNFAPVVTQIDRALRWSASYASPSRADDDVDDYLDPDCGATQNGVTGWIHDGHEFEVERLEPDDDPVECNATSPRATDRGVGLPTSGWFTFMAGTDAENLTDEVESGDDLAETADADEYYLSVQVGDVFGAMGADSNLRTRINDNSVEGASPGDADELVDDADARFGVDHVNPCFTNDGLVCAVAAAASSELSATGQVIGVAGEATAGNGGVRDGSILAVQILDLENSAGGLPGTPDNPVIARIRREFPDLSSDNRCMVGFGSSCSFAGTTNQRSGIETTFDYLTGVWTSIDPLTGLAVGGLDIDPAAVGYYNTEWRPVDNAGNEGSTTFTLRFVRDIVAPTFGGGVSFTPSVAPGGQVAFQTNAQDDLELDRVDMYLAYTGISLRRASAAIGEFGPAAYTGNPLTTGPVGVSSGSFQFISAVQVGAGGGSSAATAGVFRVYDFGRNVAEVLSAGVPTLTSAPAALDPITTASLFASANTLCWDTDNNGCTNPAAATVTLQVLSETQPFVSSGVQLYVGQDANNDGAIDLDTSGNELWNPLAGAFQGSTQTQAGPDLFTYTRAGVNAAAIAAAARRTTLTGVPANDVVHVRVVGIRSNGTAFTVAAGAALCPAVAGTDAACTLQLATN